MTEKKIVLWWINREIPDFLDKFSSFDDFINNFPFACASNDWKMFCLAMAKERWNIKHDIKL